MKLFQEIAAVLQARRNCAKIYEAKDAQDWGETEIRAKEMHDKHGKRLDKLVKNYLPSGGGIDCGTKLDEDACKPGEIVFTFGYHHMNENGFYDGWTDHKCVIVPSFDPDGIDLYFTSRDRNQVNDYSYDVYHEALTQEIDINAYETPFDENDPNP